MRCGALRWDSDSGGAEAARCKCSLACAAMRRHAKTARGDALLAMPKGMLVLDVNIVHAPAVAFLEGTVATGSSADVDGAAAAIGEKDKEDEYHRGIDGGVT